MAEMTDAQLLTPRKQRMRHELANRTFYLADLLTGDSRHFTDLCSGTDVQQNQD